MHSDLTQDPRHVAILARADSPEGLRILLTQPQAENAGAQEISRLVARELSARGHHTRQVFFFRRTSTFQEEGGTGYCAERQPSTPLGYGKLFLNFYREVRAFRPDIVLCFQHYGNVIGAPIARLAGARAVIANQNSAPAIIGGPVRLLDRWFGTAGLYDKIISVSLSATADFEAYPDAYKKRMLRLDHGFDLKRSALSQAKARERFGLPVDAPVMGCAARLHHKKNQAAAIRAISTQPTWHLALAGQGPDLEQLKEIAHARGCSERVHFLGELTAHGIADFYAALDVFVFPSTAETFGLAAVEAAAAGVPVVANDIPVLREVLSAGGEPCALFVETNKERELAGAITKVLGDSHVAASLSEVGRKLADRYPLDLMVSGFEDLIYQIARRPARV